MIGCQPPPPPEQAPEQAEEHMLVFSETAGFRHQSIPDGIAALEKLGAEMGFAVDSTEDSAAFTDENLARYDAVLFLNTTGDALDDAQQASFERFIQAGGGYVGVHAATDTEYDWPWYGKLVGAYFDRHPAIQPAVLDVIDRSHPSTRMLPERWERTDEWYDFHSINPDIHVLITIDESTYEGASTGDPHPMAWYHEYDGGRVFVTALGHTSESFTEDAFLQHLAGGIEWVLGR
jgi:type 1 glutamine amidotransferase